MKRSQRYRDLVERLSELRHCFLPRKFDPLGNYDNETLLKASAYIVLAHAEIESFIEDRAQETALAAIKSWKEHKKANCVLIGLVAKYAKVDNSSPNEINEKIENNKISIMDLVDRSITAFSNEIDKNHGIRGFNINKLLTPIGIEIGSFDPTWILNMESYGKRRGEIAHKSRTKYTAKKQINPEEEFETVNSLVGDGLKKLDFLTEGLIKGSAINDFDFMLGDFLFDDPESEISEAMSCMFSSSSGGLA
jgi:hypothetical protein